MDTTNYVQFIAALIFVIVLIYAVAGLAQRFGMVPRMSGPRGARRLSIVEHVTLDPKRRLVLVRRDEVEHLLLLGATGDVVIETRISTAATLPALEPAPLSPRDTAP